MGKEKGGGGQRKGKRQKRKAKKNKMKEERREGGNLTLYSDPSIFFLFNVFSFTLEKSRNTVHISSNTVNQSARDR